MGAFLCVAVMVLGLTLLCLDIRNSNGRRLERNKESWEMARRKGQRRFSYELPNGNIAWYRVADGYALFYGCDETDKG